jgi:hypothetical protein
MSRRGGNHFHYPGKEVPHMNKEDIALDICLAAIEKGFFYRDGNDNTELGKAIADLYNGILDNLNIED